MRTAVAHYVAVRVAALLVGLTIGAALVWGYVMPWPVLAVMTVACIVAAVTLPDEDPYR